MEIVPVDPFDEDALAAAYATYEASDRHGRGDLASPWRLEEVRVDWQADLPQRWLGAYAAVEGGVVVATGWVTTPLQDNPHLAQVEVHAHPDHRRRGHGSALLRHLEQVARDRGRTVLEGETAWPYELGPEGDGHGSVQFLRRHGWTLALGDVQRRLTLPVADALLEALAAEAAPHHAAYRLETFVGAVPEGLVEEYAALSASLVTEAPVGELDLEPETPDVAAFRAAERVLEQQGRTRYAAVALGPDGHLAGFTDLMTSAHDPGRVYQWGTLVPREHRGRRLGLALKVANLRAFQAARPDVHTVVTYNAEVNAHMIGVNERLGFVPVERLGEFQKRLG